MKVTMLLADSAQAVEGKLYILGGGWSVTSPGIPSAIALHFQVPWDQTDDPHHFRLELLTSDGDPVVDDAGNHISVDGDFQTGRPAGTPRGASIDVPMAVGFPPLPLQPGQRYEWKLNVDGVVNDDWRLPFNCQAPPVPPGL